MQDPLGAYEPPEGSVVHDSAWRVDPVAASGGYAWALTAAVLVAIAWVVWGLVAGAEPSPLNALEHAAAAAPWVVGCALLAIMGLGATKRCFGFGRGTAHALVMAALFQVATYTSGLGALGRDAWVLLIAVPTGGGAAVATFLAWRHRKQVDHARQSVAGFAYFAWAIALLRAAALRFELHRAMGGEGGAMVSAGVFLGAALAAIPWLARHGFRSGT